MSMSNLSLKPVTYKNHRAAEAPEVFPYQTGFIESVAEYMKEADQLAAWHPMCIYDIDSIMGFTMYGMIQEPAYTRLWFDCLLIDKQHQGKGYAKPAVQLILQEIRTHYPNANISLSVYAQNHPAIALYRSFGFAFTGELDTKGEEIMIYRNAL